MTGLHAKRGLAVLSIILLLGIAYLTGRSHRRSVPCAPTISLDEFRWDLMKSGIWSGGPDRLFEEIGRRTLATSIESGLMPSHKVLDIGAGSLRIGWWLLQYIDPANYYAIEPVKERIDTAADILGVEFNTYYNDDWEFPSVPFDFVLARSIWTHASKPMISKMLTEFAENSAPAGKFLTSVNLARSAGEDYQGDEWVGKIQKDDKPAMVKHSMQWIRTACKERGLSVKNVGVLNHQTWLLITRAGDDT